MLEDLLCMWDKGVTINKIAITLGLSFGTVKVKLQTLKSSGEVQRRIVYTEPEQAVKFTRYGVKDKSQVKMRKCLGPCGKMFMSKWIGNRMCHRCVKLPENARLKEKRDEL